MSRLDDVRIVGSPIEASPLVKGLLFNGAWSFTGAGNTTHRQVAFAAMGGIVPSVDPSTIAEASSPHMVLPAGEIYEEGGPLEKALDGCRDVLTALDQIDLEISSEPRIDVNSTKFIVAPDGMHHVASIESFVIGEVLDQVQRAIRRMKPPGDVRYEPIGMGPVSAERAIHPTPLVAFGSHRMRLESELAGETAGARRTRFKYVAALIAQAERTLDAYAKASKLHLPDDYKLVDRWAFWNYVLYNTGEREAPKTEPVNARDLVDRVMREMIGRYSFSTSRVSPPDELSKADVVALREQLKLDLIFALVSERVGGIGGPVRYAYVKGSPARLAQDEVSRYLQPQYRFTGASDFLHPASTRAWSDHIYLPMAVRWDSKSPTVWERRQTRPDSFTDKEVTFRRVRLDTDEARRSNVRLIPSRDGVAWRTEQFDRDYIVLEIPKGGSNKDRCGPTHWMLSYISDPIGAPGGVVTVTADFCSLQAYPSFEWGGFDKMTIQEGIPADTRMSEKKEVPKPEKHTDERNREVPEPENKHEGDTDTVADLSPGGDESDGDSEDPDE